MLVLVTNREAAVFSFLESYKFEIWRSKNDDGTCEK